MHNTVTKPTIRQTILALAVVLMVCAISSAETMPFDKLIDSDEIMAGFAQGRNTVRVIVNLEQPAELATATVKDWHSRSFRTALKAEVLARQQQVLSLLSTHEFTLHRRFENQAGFSGELTLDGLNKLLNHPKVRSVEPDHVLKPHLAQGIPLINASVYRPTYNGQGVSIAICDSGIDYTHSKLGGGGFPNSKVIGGFDTGDWDFDPYPDSASSDNGHGTCTAGIAAGGLGSVGDYIGGVAYGAKLYALKIEDSSGIIYDSYIVSAWEWCQDHKNDDPSNPILVISNSIGGGRFFSSCDGFESALATAADNTTAAGITVLASSGNEGFCDSIASPACLSSVISVGAVYDTGSFDEWGFCVDQASCTGVTDPGCNPDKICWDTPAADMVTCYSNTASFLELLAPSHDAYTTDMTGFGGYDPGDYYPEFGGTSASAPYAAGAVACLQSAAKAINGSFLTPAEARDILFSTGDDITDGKIPITKPRINLGRAIDNLQPAPPTAEDVNATTTINTPVDVVLVATDEGLPDPPGALTYIITSLPAEANLTDPQAGPISTVPYTLANNGNIVTYTPDVNFIGSDQFTYRANDGGTLPDGGDSNTATVRLKVLIFLDEFPSTTLDSSNWPITSGTPTVDDRAENIPSQPYCLHLEKTDSVTSKAMNLSFCLTAQLQYFWQRYSTESGDDLYVDYWDGTSWQRLRTHLYNQGSTTVFTEEIISLPADALHTEFKLRYLASCSSNFDEWYIDDVTIDCQLCTLAPPALDAEPNITAGSTNTISWQPLPDANQYYAACANDVNFNNPVANSGWLGGTSYQFTNLQLGEIYFYRAKARTEPDITTWSQTIQAEFETDFLIDTFATSDENVVLAGTEGSYVSDGNITSVLINLPAEREWDVVQFTKTTQIGTILTVDILDATDALLLEDIPWAADISELVPASIKLRANLSTSNPLLTPTLQDWSVTYINSTGVCQSDWSNKQSSLQCGADGDFEPDCDVDANDLDHFVFRWLHIDCNDTAGDDSDWCYGADITKNSVVDFYDYTRLAENWMQCIGPYCE